MTDQEPGPDESDLDLEDAHQVNDDEPSSSPWWYRAAMIVLEHAGTILGAMGLVGVVAVGLLDIDIPRWLMVSGIAAALTAPTFGRWSGQKAISLLWDPRYIWLIDLDATEQDAAIYRAPSQKFRELTVTDGALDWVTPTLAIAKDVDLEEMTARGTWRGTYTDRKLLRSIDAVRELRGQLEDDARRGWTIETRAHSIIHHAVRREVLSVVSTFEKSTLPDDGNGLTEAINEALERWDIDRDIRREDDSEDPTEEAPGAIATESELGNGVGAHD